jgi:two-component system, NtrC family, response regulator GlrR
MEETRIFLIDLGLPSETGNTLKTVLNSCEELTVQIHQRNIKSREATVFDNLFNTTFINFNPHLIFLVLSSNDLNQAKALLQFMRGKCYPFPVIAVSEDGKAEDIIKLLKFGVVDFIIPPIKKADLLPRIWKFLEQNPEEKTLQILKERIGLKQLVGKDPAFLSEIEKIPLTAKCDVNVLILGETGTGKELCARAIHYLSPRTGHPFIPVNCGAIPIELVENELFGHEKGAFTGAFNAYPGLIHEAHGGTLFLDEIDCLPLQMQVKLLRFIQDKEYRQLGSAKMHQADVRIIAASNIDLEKMVSEGGFRRDLFYRLNVISIALPALRERKADIPLIANHFLDKYAFEFNKQAQNLSSEALQKLLIYEWPGNVRELENVIQRIIVFALQPIIQKNDIVLSLSKNIEVQESFQTNKSRAVAQFERSYIQKILLAYHGNISQAAKAAQKNRRAFWELIRKHNIDVPQYKSNFQKPGI